MGGYGGVPRFVKCLIYGSGAHAPTTAAVAPRAAQFCKHIAYAAEAKPIQTPAPGPVPTQANMAAVYVHVHNTEHPPPVREPVAIPETTPALADESIRHINRAKVDL